jgi:hypothetical protein
MTYKTETKGFRVTGVAGLERIEIYTTVSDALTYVEIQLVATDDFDGSYDLDGLSDLVEGLHEALRLARNLTEEITTNARDDEDD